MSRQSYPKNSIETSQDLLIDIFNDLKQTIGQNINTSQNISVNCGDEPIPDYLLEKEYDYNIFGMKKVMDVLSMVVVMI